MARGAGDAGRDHAAAALVAVSPHQGFVLVAHGSGAAAGADGAAAARPQSRSGSRSASCSPRTRKPVRDWITGPTGSPLAAAFGLLDRLLRVAEPLFPARSRRRAIDKAVAFVTERLNGEDGLGGIFPAMANSLMMFDCLGYPPDHPACRTAESAIHKLLVLEPERSYCQPCLSPVWDTALACHALMEAGDRRLDPAIAAGARLARGQAGAGGRRRLGGGAARLAARRLGLPIREPVLPRCRRHRRRRPGARPLRSRALSRRHRAARPNGSSACRAATAAGAPSTPTTRITI